MAGAIIFTKSRMWTSSSNFFCDIMTGAMEKCRASDERLVPILLIAEKTGFLSINREEDYNLQILLAERVREAAREKLEKLRADPATHPEDIRIVEELLATSQAHLSEL